MSYATPPEGGVLWLGTPDLTEDEEFLPPPSHPWERPLLVVCVAVTIVLATLLSHAAWSVTGSRLWTIAALCATPAGCWLVRGLRHARHRAESVKISPTQFPEVYRMVVSLSESMGLLRPPDAYVTAGRGDPLRTDASGHGLRRYLVLSGELFDASGQLRDPDVPAFLIAHQIGHIATGHTGYWRRVATSGAELVPGLGAALSRAQEYTADNHAHTHLPEVSSAVRIFASGAHTHTRVNMGEMAARAHTDRGCSLLLYHLFTRRPSNIRRMAALRDRSRRGRVFL